jgi:hypothetical protein
MVLVKRRIMGYSISSPVFLKSNSEWKIFPVSQAGLIVIH